MAMKILIFGATGFLGKKLINLLNKQKKLRIFRTTRKKENINDRVGIVVTMNNLGNIDLHKSQNNKAIEKFNSSLEISKEIGYYLGTCEALENLANTYSKMGDIDKSHNLIEKSLKIRYEIGCENGIEKTRNKMDLI